MITPGHFHNDNRRGKRGRDTQTPTLF
jgi:hypothetical protein